MLAPAIPGIHIMHTCHAQTTATTYSRTDKGGVLEHREASGTSGKLKMVSWQMIERHSLDVPEIQQTHREVQSSSKPKMVGCISS